MPLLAWPGDATCAVDDEDTTEPRCLSLKNSSFARIVVESHAQLVLDLSTRLQDADSLLLSSTQTRRAWA